MKPALVNVAGVLLGVLLLAVGCGDDDGGGGEPDAAEVAVDAAAGAVDAPVSLPDAAGPSVDGTAADAGEGTACGDDVCDPATEICYQCSCGGPVSFECMPVPEGCEADRTCDCVEEELCSGGVNWTCTDAEQDNTVYCDTGLD